MTEQKRTKAYGTDISILLLIHICRHFYFRKFSGMIHTHPLTNPLTNPTQPNPTQPNPTYPSPMAQQHSYIPGRSSPVCRHRPGDASGVVPQTDPSPLAQTTRAYLAADRGAPRPPPAPPISLRSFSPYPLSRCLRLCSRPHQHGHRSRPASGRSGLSGLRGGVELLRVGRRVRGGAAVWHLAQGLNECVVGEGG